MNFSHKFLLLLFFIIHVNLSANNCIEQLDDFPLGTLTQCESFDDLSLGNVSIQSSDFWTKIVGNGEPQVIYNPRGSGNVLQLRDNGGDLSGAIYKLGEKQYKRYRLSWKMFVEENKSAFFNIQHDEKNQYSNWAARFYFKSTGIGEVELPNRNITNFTYQNGGENKIVIIVDLETKKAEFWINNFYIISWDFPAGNSSTSNKLGAINFSAQSGDSYTIDNICVWESACSQGGIDSLIFNNIEMGLCLDNGWTIAEEDARCMLFTSSEWRACETICDLAPPFIRAGDQFEEDFKVSELAPGFLRSESCIAKDYGGWVPKNIYGEVFMLYHPEKGPLIFEGFWFDPPLGSLRGYLFTCDDNMQECLGAFENGDSFPDLESGFYYVVMVSTNLGEFGFNVSPDDKNCLGEVVNIECGEMISGLVERGSNQFDFLGSEIDAYSDCYNGGRNYHGSDSVFALNILSPQSITITLESTSPSGLFLYNEVCGKTCITFAESNNLTSISDLFLIPGFYYLIIDSDDPDSDFEFSLSVECSSIDDFNFFTNSSRQNCLTDIDDAHSINVPKTSNLELLDLSPTFYFIHENESGEEEIINDASFVFSGNESVFTIPADREGDSDKCAYNNGEPFKFFITERFQSNQASLLDAIFLEPGTGGATASDLFDKRKLSAVQKINKTSTIGFNISPGIINLSDNKTEEYSISINPTFSWSFSVSADSEWVDFEFRSNPDNQNIFNPEPNFIFISAQENNSIDNRKAVITLFSTENNLFNYDLEITQLGKSVTSVTNNIQDDNILVFPNPASDEILINKSVGSSQMKKVLLFDILGNNIPFEEINSSNNSIKIILPKVSSGIYFISGEIENIPFVKRVIIKNKN